MVKPVKTRASQTMTDAAFVSFVKGHLRRASRFWPVSSVVRKKAKLAYGVYKCQLCGNPTRAKDTVIDHIEPVVDIYSNPTEVDWNSIVERLFCEESGLQLVCKDCHNNDKTKKENEIRKKVSNFSKSFPSEYNSWRSAYKRCYWEKDIKYPIYGAIGITMCEEWLPNQGSPSGFENFLRDLGPRPEGTTLDRVDGEKGYNKENCRWADIFTQNKNRKTVYEFEVDGGIYTLKELAEKVGISKSTLQTRLTSKTFTMAVTSPTRKRVDVERGLILLSEGKTNKEIADILGCHEASLRKAIRAHKKKEQTNEI